jgi:sterol carrier protein 2
MGVEAARLALQDACVDFGRIQQAYAGYVFDDSVCGQRVFYELGMNGIPVVNLTNN